MADKEPSNAQSYQGPSTETIANKLIDIRLPQIIEELLTTKNELYEGQLGQLQRQLEDDSVPDAAKDHLRAAVETLNEAQAKTKEPVREKIAIALLSLLREHRIPLQLRNGQPTTATTEPKKRGRRRINHDAMCDQIKMMAKQAGSEVFSTSQVQLQLGLSQPLALKLCRQLTEKGELNHNGRPRQFSRYFAKDQTPR